MTVLQTGSGRRSLAEQDTQQLGGRLSVLHRQRADHVLLDELLDELESTPPDLQRRVLLDLNRLVFPHAFAEECVLWPVLRRVLPDGDALTLQVEQEHQEVNELVARLEELDLADRARQPLLDRLAVVLREDVRDEEDELLPRLQQELAPSTLRRLGVLWEIVRRLSPTRAHPVVARRPPGNVVAALPLTLVDRTRDSLERVAIRSAPATARRLGALDRGLGRLGRKVERLPVMRSGEHPSTGRTGRHPADATAPHG